MYSCVNHPGSPCDKYTGRPKTLFAGGFCHGEASVSPCGECSGGMTGVTGGLWCDEYREYLDGPAEVCAVSRVLLLPGARTQTWSIRREDWMYPRNDVWVLRFTGSPCMFGKKISARRGTRHELLHRSCYRLSPLKMWDWSFRARGLGKFPFLFFLYPRVAACVLCFEGYMYEVL